MQLPVPECWGRTPLHQAVKSGNPTCVLLLIQAGAKVNAEDEKGTTPLLLAGAGVVPDNINDINKYERICSLYIGFLFQVVQRPIVACYNVVQP